MSNPTGLPYTPAVRAGDWVIVSGQIGLLDGELVSGGFDAELSQALKNLEAHLDSAGATMADVVKTTVFLTRIGDFDAMNQVYREFFAEPYPTRSTVGIALANPELMVEIEGIALRRAGPA